jgi:hypothetical protein
VFLQGPHVLVALEARSRPDMPLRYLRDAVPERLVRNERFWTNRASDGPPVTSGAPAGRGLGVDVDGEGIHPPP